MHSTLGYPSTLRGNDRCAVIHRRSRGQNAICSDQMGYCCISQEDRKVDIHVMTVSDSEPENVENIIPMVISMKHEGV